MLLIDRSESEDLRLTIAAAKKYIKYCAEQICCSQDNWEKLEYQILIKNKKEELKALRKRVTG